MSNPAKAAEAAVSELPTRPDSEFACEIDQNGCLVLQVDFFTNLKGKKQSACQQIGLKKQRQDAGSSIASL